jgi:hypothetical protein
MAKNKVVRHALLIIKPRRRMGSGDITPRIFNLSIKQK